MERKRVFSWLILSYPYGHQAISTLGVPKSAEVLKFWLGVLCGKGNSFLGTHKSSTIKEVNIKLGGGFKDLLFSPLFGEDSDFD